MHYHISAIDPDQDDDYLDYIEAHGEEDTWFLFNMNTEEEAPEGVNIGSLDNALFASVWIYRLTHPNAFLTYGAGCPPEELVRKTNRRVGVIQEGFI